MSSPAIAPLTEGGAPVVAVGAHEGLHVVEASGEPLAGWPVLAGVEVRSSPAIGDLRPGEESTAGSEIVVGTQAGRLEAFSPAGRSFKEWPYQVGGSVEETPALGRVKGRGSELDVVFSFDESVYLLKHDGKQHGGGWPRRHDEAMPLTPALVDLVHDERLDVVYGDTEGHLHLRDDDAQVAGWPRELAEESWLGPTVVGDADGDGEPELFVVSRSGRIWMRSADGGRRDGWPVSLRRWVDAAPALGDIDGQPGAELVVADSFGFVHVIDASGRTVDGWPRELPAPLRAPPALADITGDGRPEVLAGCEDRRLYALRADGSDVPGWPVQTGGTIRSGAAVGDLDGNGRADVVVGSDDGFLHAWELGDGSWNPETSPWPMHRQNARRTGTLP